MSSVNKLIMAGEIFMEYICFFVIINNYLPLKFFLVIFKLTVFYKLPFPTQKCADELRDVGAKMKGKSLGRKFYVFVLKFLCLLSSYLLRQKQSCTWSSERFLVYG